LRASQSLPCKDQRHQPQQSRCPHLKCENGSFSHRPRLDDYFGRRVVLAAYPALPLSTAIFGLLSTGTKYPYPSVFRTGQRRTERAERVCGRFGAFTQGPRDAQECDLSPKVPLVQSLTGIAGETTIKRPVRLPRRSPPNCSFFRLLHCCRACIPAYPGRSATYTVPYALSLAFSHFYKTPRGVCSLSGAGSNFYFHFSIFRQTCVDDSWK